MPEDVMQTLLSDNQKKAKLNPLLADFKAMSHTGTVYAVLRCTDFVEAHKLFAEGGRTFNDQSDGLRLCLQDSDAEGKMIQEKGVVAIVYSAKMWGTVLPSLDYCARTMSMPSYAKARLS